MYFFTFFILGYFLGLVVNRIINYLEAPYYTMSGGMYHYYITFCSMIIGGIADLVIADFANKDILRTLLKKYLNIEIATGKKNERLLLIVIVIGLSVIVIGSLTGALYLYWSYMTRPA